MKYCPLCETTYGDDIRICSSDGAQLRSGEAKADPLLGQTIRGRYRVIRRLGEGGMGSVYLAEQISVGRKVALKVLHGEFAKDDAFVRRFRQEARLAASLNHASVTTVFDFDQGDDTSLFIVMEYVQGRTLAAVIRQEGALDVRRAIGLGIQIAEGLEAAHRAGVIHRDVKPQNIMLIEPGDVVKLTDFGIARLRDTDETQLTRAGTMMGTPNYMAPEQIEGRTVSEKTDLYAFGVVLYEMLGGRVPFSAPTPAAVLIKHLQEVPAPIRTVRQEVPAEVEQLLIRALEKEPARRQGSMGEVVLSLRQAAGLVEAGMTKAMVVPPTVVGLPTGRAGPTESSPVTAVSLPTGASPNTELVTPTAVASEAARTRFRWAWLTGGRWKYVTVGALLVLLVTVGVRVALVSKPPDAPPGPSGSRTEKNQSGAGASDAPPATPSAAPAPPPEAVPPPVEKRTSSNLAKRATPRPPSDPIPAPSDQTPGPPITPSKPPEAGVLPPRVEPPAMSDPNLIRTVVEQKLRSAGLLKGAGAAGLGVTVDISSDRVVTITGVLRDEEQRLEAIRLTRDVQGVSDVKHRINLRTIWPQG